MTRAKQTTPLKRVGQTVVAANKRKRPQEHEDTPRPGVRTKIFKPEEDGFEDNEVEENQNNTSNNQGGGGAGVETTTIEEDMFWEEDRQGKDSWVTEARKYRLPISSKTLALACPADECLKMKGEMTPVYIECKSRQGGTYVSMMYCCNYCNAMTESREEAQKNNIFAGHNVSKFVQNYIRRARDCGIKDISTIPVPGGLTCPGMMPSILNQASDKLPTIDVSEKLKAMETKLEEIHHIIIKEFGKKKPAVIMEDEFEKIELVDEEEEEIPCSQVTEES